MEMMNHQMQMMQQQAEQSRKDGERQLQLIMQMKQDDQRAALEELERKSEQARLEQEEKFRILEKQRKEEAEQQMLELQVKLTIVFFFQICTFLYYFLNVQIFFCTLTKFVKTQS